MDWTNNLPAELCIEILKNLDVKEILAISQTCKRWHSLVKQTEMLWKHLVKAYCLEDCQYQAYGNSKFMWQDTFKKTYGKNGTKHLWKSGHFNRIQNVEELYPHKTYALSAQDWGDIFELELSR